MQNFYEIASIFEHDHKNLDAGQELVTYIKIPSLEMGRKILSRTSDEQRKQRNKVFYRGIESRQRLFQGKHDRGEEYVFANGTINTNDMINIESHLPLHSKLISVKNKTIQKNEIWDLTTHPKIWGFGAREELYVSLNIETLILEPNAKLIIQGNVCSINIQQIIRKEARSSSYNNDFDIGILPTTVSVDQKYGPHNGEDGTVVRNGRNGKDGLNPNVSSNMFGPIVEDEHLFINPQNGTDGENGEDGITGKPGRNGGMVKLCEIHIGKLSGFTKKKLTFYTKAGDGGNGGNGSRGGNGGNGGNGGDGIQAQNIQITQGIGGNGGKGGKGGDGGHAGSGGISSNIFIEIPEMYKDSVICISMPSMGGKGGSGTEGGTGGEKGLGGNLLNTFDQLHKLKDGQRGQDGIHGRNGKDGKTRPGANFFINGNQYIQQSKAVKHSNISLVKKVTKAIIKWNLSGFARVDESTLERRENRCLVCPHLEEPKLYLQKISVSKPQKDIIGKRIEGKVCNLCGCVVSKKILLPFEKCPDPHPDNSNMTRWKEERIL